MVYPLSFLSFFACSEYALDTYTPWPWNSVEEQKYSFSSVYNDCLSLTSLSSSLLCDEFSDTASCKENYERLQYSLESLSFFQEDTRVLPFLSSIDGMDSQNKEYSADEYFLQFENSAGYLLQCNAQFARSGCEQDLQFPLEASICYLLPEERTGVFSLDFVYCHNRNVSYNSENYSGEHFLRLRLQYDSCPWTTQILEVYENGDSFSVLDSAPFSQETVSHFVTFTKNLEELVEAAN